MPYITNFAIHVQLFHTYITCFCYHMCRTGVLHVYLLHMYNSGFPMFGRNIPGFSQGSVQVKMAIL